MKKKDSSAGRAIVIGAGHNGLVCAFYLARAGWRVDVYEKRPVLGGAAITDSFFPGFRNSIASYTVSLLDEAIIEDMRLRDLGLRIVERPLSNFLPLEDGKSLSAGGGLAATQASFAKISEKDAAALPAYYAQLERMGQALAKLAREVPPAWEAESSWRNWLKNSSEAFARLRDLGQLSAADRQVLLRLMGESAEDHLSQWFESDAVKALFSFDAVVGHLGTPRMPGSAYVLLHHCFGGVNGKQGQWGHAIGGMGSITQAMVRACEQLGVGLHRDAPVHRIVHDRGRAQGVMLESGLFKEADVLACNTHPRIMSQQLLNDADLPEDFRRSMSHYQSESASFRMNVALSCLPRFIAHPEQGPHHSSGIILSPSLQWMDQAYRDAIDQGMAKRPIVEMLIPSTVDDTLAPEGCHVASLFCQHFRRELPGGVQWDEAQKQTAVASIFQVIEAFAPGFKQSILGYAAHSPLDLERDFSLVGGDIFHGKMSLSQLWAARPLLGWGAYRMPLAGLYLCGSGAHPGGGVSGLPGRHAARQILRDRQAIPSFLSRAFNLRRQS
ncbi:MAG: phytoene desaturase family protein [Burkholderiaceae bacterium]|jgi:phytoene dehydrogenase-like protein